MGAGSAGRTRIPRFKASCRAFGRPPHRGGPGGTRTLISPLKRRQLFQFSYEPNRALRAQYGRGARGTRTLNCPIKSRVLYPLELPPPIGAIQRLLYIMIIHLLSGGGAWSRTTYPHGNGFTDRRVSRDTLHPRGRTRLLPPTVRVHASPSATCDWQIQETEKAAWVIRRRPSRDKRWNAAYVPTSGSEPPMRTGSPKLAIRPAFSTELRGPANQHDILPAVAGARYVLLSS